MFRLLSVMIYISLFHVPIVICFSEYSNEWLAEINATEYETKIIAKRYGFEYINKIGDDVYVLHIEVRGNVQKMSGKNSKREAEQQKWNRRVLRSVVVNDPYWPNMWYLNGQITPDMGVRLSWDKGYTGKGVTLGIVDNRFDINHADLKPNYNALLSNDVLHRNKDPTPAPGEKHGTECAGIPLAAANNTNCVIGVAFESQLAGIRLLGIPSSTSSSLLGISVTTSTVERGALIATGIDIYSNSWGVVDKTTFDGPSSIVKSALLQGTHKGRNGLGVIYVWAAGNGGSGDNCNCDGYVNSIYTVAISSVSSKLQPPEYAEPCAAIMASTLSGEGGTSNKICTTSLHGTCETSFSGTSAATPMAAGIFALVLQANPSLTWRDLQHLIVNTSDMTNLKYGRPQINGAGRTVSDYFGFCLLKSDLLIDRAKQWDLVTEQHICLCTPERHFHNKPIIENDPNRNIFSYVCTNGCNYSSGEVQTLEHAEVDISYFSSYRDAVQFFLISPSGTKSQLLTRRRADLKFSRQVWTFMSVQFWDENSDGNWTLQMSLDMDYGVMVYTTCISETTTGVKQLVNKNVTDMTGTSGITVMAVTDYETTIADADKDGLTAIYPVFIIVPSIVIEIVTVIIVLVWTKGKVQENSKIQESNKSAIPFQKKTIVNIHYVDNM